MAELGNTKDLAVARVYAASTLEIAEAEKTADQVLSELGDLAGLVQSSPELSDYFSRPTVDPGQREEALERMFRGRCLDVVTDLLQILNRKGRLSLLPAVAKTYQQAHDELRGRIEVSIRSAVPLNEAQKETLRAWAQRYTGKIPDLIEGTDLSLLAGIAVQIEDEKFDMSAAQRLSGFRQRLLDRASREIYGGKTYVTPTA